MRRTSGTGARLLLPQCVMVIALLAAAFGVLVPHLRSMRLWAEMAAQPMSEPLMLRIDAAMKRNANPYCLFYLLDWQVKSGRYAEARETLKRLDFLIPHYRERDYLEALLAVKETDIERARRLGLATMDRDRYYQPNLALLTTIGAAVRDTSLVFSALMAMSEWAAIRSGFSWRGREEIDVSADPSIEGIEIRHAAGGTQVVWSDALVDGIYRWRTATLRGWDTATQNRFRSWLDKEFSVREVADVTRSTEVTDRFSELLQSGLIRLVQ